MYTQYKKSIKFCVVIKLHVRKVFTRLTTKADARYVVCFIIEFDINMSRVWCVVFEKFVERTKAKKMVNGSYLRSFMPKNSVRVRRNPLQVSFAGCTTN